MANPVVDASHCCTSAAMYSVAVGAVGLPIRLNARARTFAPSLKRKSFACGSAADRTS